MLDCIWKISDKKISEKYLNMDIWESECQTNVHMDIWEVDLWMNDDLTALSTCVCMDGWSWCFGWKIYSFNTTIDLVDLRMMKSDYAYWPHQIPLLVLEALRYFIWCLLSVPRCTLQCIGVICNVHAHERVIPWSRSNHSM